MCTVHPASGIKVRTRAGCATLAGGLVLRDSVSCQYPHAGASRHPTRSGNNELLPGV